MRNPSSLNIDYERSEKMEPCPFCRKIELREFTIETEFAIALLDAFPLSPGHILIVPRRHESDFFKLTEVEEFAVWRVVRDVRNDIENRLAPQGYNVGINIGFAAGQTVEHAHVHLIPRYRGDVDDPRGGIRWMIPKKAPCWKL
jgi:diadenosine tetraphosphate (Ap4A) HIT family hydrolase